MQLIAGTVCLMNFSCVYLKEGIVCEWIVVRLQWQDECLKAKCVWFKLKDRTLSLCYEHVRNLCRACLAAAANFNGLVVEM